MKFLFYIEYLLAKLIILIFGLLPRCALEKISFLIADAGFFLFRKKRNVALENLRIAFRVTKPEAELKRIARESLRSLICALFEFFCIARPDLDLKEVFIISEQVQSKLDKYLDQENGAVLFTAHFGNWEFIAYPFAKRGKKLSVVGRPTKNPYLYKLVKDYRAFLGAENIDKNNAVRGTIQAIKNKGFVGLVIDQRAGDAGEIVSFFGRPSLTTTLPAILAKKFDCFIVPIFAVRRSFGKFEVVVDDPISFIENPEEPRDMKPTAEACNRAIEKIISQYPGQWLWYHRRWRL